MTEDQFANARADAEAAAGRISPLLQRLLHRLSEGSGVSAVYGEPVERGSLTVIPVAQSAVGLGGGGGEDGDDTSAGFGIGGGSLTRPIGYIEMTDRSVRFVPLHRPWADSRLLLTYGLLVLLVGRLLVRLLRG